MYFKKKKHKKHKNSGLLYSTEGCLKDKTKKRFGLTSLEMDTLISSLTEKEKIPIVKIQ